MEPELPRARQQQVASAVAALSLCVCVASLLHSGMLKRAVAAVASAPLATAAACRRRSSSLLPPPLAKGWAALPLRLVGISQDNAKISRVHQYLPCGLANLCNPCCCNQAFSNSRVLESAPLVHLQ